MEFGPPLVNPPKIWGIGLNYRDHASDLAAEWPSEPASFMKPGTTLIGQKENIVLPPDSSRVTAEAELGGSREEMQERRSGRCRSVVFGYVPLLDMTAEDILRRNPRFLTRAKSYDTFLSLGPCIVSPDEVQDLGERNISTVVNGEVKRTNKVKNMAFPPDYLVAFHSRIFTFEPGDIILTGTPGAAKISFDGDEVECRIDGFPSLRNFVKGGGKGQMILLLSEDDVTSLMDMKTTIACIEAAFKEQSCENRVLMPPRQVMKENNSDAVVEGFMAASASPG